MKVEVEFLRVEKLVGGAHYFWLINGVEKHSVVDQQDHVGIYRDLGVDVATAAGIPNLARQK